MHLSQQFCSKLVGVTEEEGGVGDLFELQRLGEHSRSPAAFGSIDFAKLRTQTVFGGDASDDDDDDDDDDDSDANGEEDGSGEEEDAKEDADDEGGQQGGNEQASTARYARFAVVPKDAPLASVLWLMEHHWGLVRPGSLISISGGVELDGLHPLLAQILTRGLNAAVDQTDGWVLSTGLDTSVSRLFGTGMRASGETAPCIGIAAWSACSRGTRVSLVNALRRGLATKMLAPGGQPSGQACERAAGALSYELEPHHSHFLLVDGGQTGATGDSQFTAASALRHVLEEHMDSEWEVPQLVLCLGSFESGRLKTLRFITQKLKAGVPVVFVRETKGVAGLVARFMHTLRPQHKLSLQDPVHLGQGEKAWVSMPKRFTVPSGLIPWKVLFPAYSPPYFCSENVLRREAQGADPEVSAEEESQNKRGAPQRSRCLPVVVVSVRVAPQVLAKVAVGDNPLSCAPRA